MISCLIAVQVWAMTSYHTVAVPTDSLREARAIAAIEAGRMIARHPSTRNSRFGFDCGKEGWIAIDLDQGDVFARRSLPQAPSPQ